MGVVPVLPSSAPPDRAAGQAHGVPAVKARLRHFTHGTTGEDLGWALQVLCPGCNARKGRGGLHQVGVLGPNGEPAYGEQWDWDRNLEAPTLSPSIAVSDGTGVVCHSYLKAGRWEFLSDSQHPLAGQTGVPMVDLPDWLTSD